MVGIDTLAHTCKELPDCDKNTPWRGDCQWAHTYPPTHTHTHTCATPHAHRVGVSHRPCQSTARHVRQRPSQRPIHHRVPSPLAALCSCCGAQVSIIDLSSEPAHLETLKHTAALLKTLERHFGALCFVAVAFGYVKACGCGWACARVCVRLCTTLSMQHTRLLVLLFRACTSRLWV